MKLPPCPRCRGRLTVKQHERSDGVGDSTQVDIACLNCGRTVAVMRRVVRWEVVQGSLEGAA